GGRGAARAGLAPPGVGEALGLGLMAVNSAGRDGCGATGRIRAVESERGGPRTPIIALTANAFDEDRETCLLAGMDGFLTKPLDRERLTAALASATVSPPLPPRAPPPLPPPAPGPARSNRP